MEKNVVRARAADNSGRIESVFCAKRLAQRRGGAVRIILETIGKGTKSFRARGDGPSGVSFAESLKVLGGARRGTLARNIRVDVKNSWARAWPCLGPGHGDFCHPSKLPGTKSLRRQVLDPARIEARRVAADFGGMRAPAEPAQKEFRADRQARPPSRSSRRDRTHL